MTERDAPTGDAGGGTLAHRLRSLLADLDAAAHGRSPNGEAPDRPTDAAPPVVTGGPAVTHEPVVRETAPEVVPDAAPETAPDAAPETAPEVAPAAGPDAPAEAAPGALGAPPEAGPATAHDVEPDEPDARPQAGPEPPPEPADGAAPGPRLDVEDRARAGVPLETDREGVTEAGGEAGAPPPPAGEPPFDAAGPPAAEAGGAESDRAGRPGAPAARTPRRRKPRRYPRLRAAVFAVTLVALVVAIPVLIYLGVQTISDSNQGKVIEPETDASAPGFEAVVEPTPTLLLAHEDADGALAGLTVLGLGLDDEGGDVLFIPVGTLVDIPSLGMDRLGAAFDRGGIDLLRESSEGLLGIRFTDAVRVGPARWEELVAPVAPLGVVIPDPIEVVGADGQVTVAFPAGTVEVAADQVSALLALQSVGETQLARLVRHQAFWEAWLEAVGTSTSPDAVPGEVSTGLGRFVRGLSQGDVVYETLQVQTVDPTATEGGEAYQADRDAVASQISALLPFAAAPEGGERASVRVLNGTPDPGLAQAVTQVLVPAGAEIRVIGNADRFDYERTQVVFYDQAQEAVAERLQAALGVGEVVFSRVPNDAVDVTVVVGGDFEPPAADDGADEAGSDSTG